MAARVGGLPLVFALEPCRAISFATSSAHATLRSAPETRASGHAHHFFLVEDFANLENGLASFSFRVCDFHTDDRSLETTVTLNFA